MSKLKRSIITLAIPAIIENFLHIMLSTVDTYFVATLGSMAISAVGINTLVSNLYLTFYIALGTGISILTARAQGAKNRLLVNTKINNGLLLTACVSLVFVVFNIVLGHDFLHLIGRDYQLVETAHIYFNVVIIPIFSLGFMTVLSSIIKSLGDTKTPMYTVLLINVINIVLDYLLIVRFAILGAAIATTTARLIGMFILLYHLNKKTRFIQDFKFDFSKGIHEMIGYAIPVGLEKMSMRIGQLIYGGLIVTIGIAHYTAHNIAGTIEAYSYLPGMGFGIASFTLIGQAIGQEEFRQIQHIGKWTFRLSTLMMLFVGLIFYIFAPFLAGLFTTDQTIIGLVTAVLRIIALFQPFLCSTQVIASSLQALGDVRFPLILTTFGIWGIRIVGTIVLGIYLKLGLVGVWIAYAIDVIFRGTMLWIRFRLKTSDWQKLRKEYN